MRRAPIHSLLVLAVIAGAIPARGQGREEGPIVIGERGPQWRRFELRKFEAALDLSARYQRDHYRSEGLPDRTDTETRLQEYLEFGGEAYIGHKNLIDLTGDARLGLNDYWTHSDTTASSGHLTDLSGYYHLSALCLAESKSPFTLYSKREQAIMDQAFGSSVRTVTMETGGRVTLRFPDAPTNLHAYHLDSSQSGVLGLSRYSLTQDSFNAQSNMIVGERHRLELDYSFDHVDETPTGGLSDVYTRHDASAVDTILFGGTKHHELRSYLKFFDQGGRGDLQVLRLDEQLSLHHAPSFDTGINATLERQERLNVEQRLARASAYARHRLFDSLVSTGTVGGQMMDVPGTFRQHEYFATGDLQYTKRVPYGRLSIGASANFDSQHNGERGSPLHVNDEPHTFTDPQPIVLARRNVVRGSLVITPSSGFPAFDENVAYTVAYFPDRVEVSVIPGQGISNGQTLLIDYDLGPEPASDIDTVGEGASIRYTVDRGWFQGLSGYGTYRQTDHTLSGASSSLVILDDVRDLTYGLEYARGGVFLKAERQNHDSTVSPFDLTRFQAMYTRSLGAESTLSLDATHEVYDYRNPVNQLVFTRGTARWIQRLNREWGFNAKLEVRDERNDLLGNSRHFDQTLGVHWRKRQTSAYVNVRNSIANAARSDTTSQSLEFGIRRNF